jgi:nicotinamide mononucleotide transporter
MLEVLLDWASPLLAAPFTIFGAAATWLEIIAFVLSLAMVVANMRVNPIGWPLAIVASLLYALLFAQSKLYGEALLQIFFVAVAFWGWWQWHRGRGSDGQALRVHRLTRRGIAFAVGATLAAWPLVGLALASATDSDVPYGDALATVGSVTGQILLGRKLIENWIVWLLVNVFSVGLFAVKGLWLTVILYAIFALLSVAGWWAWRRRLEPASPPL